ncbi:putative pyridoxal phosphate-dependent enzyme [Aulographum hederae CBS 113979]|uniref:Putative pyridoxal phosphate-dependent enzyme n=1 Tax=Aulographum hederae CBS 113979 TaxID=1176131 RepID=A0A6G1H042_9PEZI|nr:putative pyridoxal phosphate-dependent enzyme [Aulographum hederae CBS 113979]
MPPPKAIKFIPTTSTTIVGTELANIQDVLTTNNLSGKGKYTKLCESWLQNSMKTGRPFLVSSCTSALEIAAILANIQPGDEIILPSYTYVSTANAFVVRGAVPVFVDLDDRTMNIDANLIEAAITPKTKVIVPMHYGGIACDMDAIMSIAQKHNLLVVEDAAQACTSTYKGRALGTIGHMGCISFQEKKNLTAGGQGGALLVNDATLLPRAEIIYEHGTSRAQFARGEVERYQWLDLGTNATLCEVQAAFLYAQLLASESITGRRLEIWERYYEGLAPLAGKGVVKIPRVPDGGMHNANIFYVRLEDPGRREAFQTYMAEGNIGIQAQFVPLHSSVFGKEVGRFVGQDRVTTLASLQIVLLPVHLGVSDDEAEVVVRRVLSFWEEEEEGEEGVTVV